jgi:hypothetical protein
MPARTPTRIEQWVLAARRRRRRGAAVLAAELVMTPSTVGRMLARHQLPHMAAIDPITGQRVRSSRRSENRDERTQPGSMIYVDVKKLARVPRGGGWRAHGPSEALKGRGDGYDFVHTRSTTTPGWPKRSPARREGQHPAPGSCTAPWPGSQAKGVHVRRVYTDNAKVYRIGTAWAGSARPGSSNDASPNRLPLDQRQSRTLQTHPAHRMGRRSSLDQQHPPPTRPRQVPHLRQHSTRPLRPRRTPSDQQARRLTTTCQVTTPGPRHGQQLPLHARRWLGQPWRAVTPSRLLTVRPLGCAA